MRGDLRAVSVRSLPRLPRPHWSQRIASLRHQRRARRLEALELIERLDRLERASHRDQSHSGDLARARRWC